MSIWKKAAEDPKRAADEAVKRRFSSRANHRRAVPRAPRMVESDMPVLESPAVSSEPFTAEVDYSQEGFSPSEVRSRRRMFAEILSPDGTAEEPVPETDGSKDLLEDSKTVLLTDLALDLVLRRESGGDTMDAVDAILDAGNRFDIREEACRLCLQAADTEDQEMCGGTVSRVMDSGLCPEGVAMQAFFISSRRLGKDSQATSVVSSYLKDDDGPDGELYRFLENREGRLEDSLLDWVSYHDSLVYECLGEASILISNTMAVSDRTGYLSKVRKRIDRLCPDRIPGIVLGD